MTFEDMVARAAADRAASVRTHADRPSQRRCAPEGGSQRTFAKATIEVRSSADVEGALSFRGVASMYERGYEMYDAFGPYVEVVSRGAAEDIALDGLDVPLVLEHDSLRRIARTTNGTLQLSQNDEGLQVYAPRLDPADADVAYILPKLRSGLIDEMSFKFLITDGVWSDDFTEYRINGYRINRGDVAIVGYGANPYTKVSLRDAAPADTACDCCDMAAGPCDCGDCPDCANGAEGPIPVTQVPRSRLMPLPGETDARHLRV